MENVRSGRIVDNDDVAELAPEPAEVFDVVPSVENAGFSEEPCSKDPPLVEQVCHRVSILGEPSTHTHTLPASITTCGRDIQKSGQELHSQAEI